MAESETSIPKFASFRPKATSKGHVDEIKDRPKTKHEDHGHHRGRRGEKSRRSQSDKQARRHSSPSKDINQDLVLQKGDHMKHRNEDSDLYVIDRKGDAKNLSYGSVHRWGVSLFHRAGAGSVLGLSPGIKIDGNHSEESGLVLSNSRISNAHRREKYAFSKVERERPRLLRIRQGIPEADPFINEGDYISLSRSKAKNYGNEELDGTALLRDEVDYRSIHGKAKSESRPADQDLEYVDESDSSRSDTGRILRLENMIRDRNTELSRRVEHSPSDLEAWLSLIDHQDNLTRKRDGRRRITNAEISSTADIKIHMFEKALQHMQKLKDRERILLGLMAEGAKVWELNEQSDRWQRISEDNIESLVLWRAYLDFKQTTFSTFRFEEVRDVYLQRLKLLLKSVSSATPIKTNELYRQIIYVLVRLTMYVRESGFSELAIAVWQVLLEVNFFGPKQLPHDEYKRRFQEYWDSEVPRIGEVESRGWCAFVGCADSSTVPDARTDEADMILNQGDTFKSWSIAERARQKASRLPARTMDDVVEDDPYRVILFSDVEPFLVLLPSTPAIRRTLIDAFLLFCRQPSIQHLTGNGEAHAWENEGFINGDIQDSDVDYIRKQFLASSRASDDEVETPDISSILSSPLANFVSSADTYFSSKWFKSPKSWHQVYAGDNGPVPYAWFRDTLRQLVEVSLDDGFAEYFLAFEWQNEPGTIKKVAKKLLKQYSSSLNLYNAYAMIEWEKGNKEIANGVFSAALRMGSSVSQNDSKDQDQVQSMDSILLWKSWIWACLEDNDHQAALKRLLSIPDGNLSIDHDHSATVLLKTKQHLTSRRDYLLSSGNVYHALLHMECLALLDYLTTISATGPQSQKQGNISAALTIFTSISETLSTHSSADSALHALLLQSSTRLIFQHIRSGPYRPTILRSHLCHCLSIFPHNTIFLALYTWNESRFSLSNLINNSLTSILHPSNDSITTHLFAIRHSLQTGTPHAIHSSFEHAVSSLACRGAAGLWRLYILWSVQTKEYKGRAKEIWLRGLRACPWCKELFLTGFEVSVEMRLGMEAGREVWRVMGEKELRVCVDLEESFEEARGRDDGGPSE